MRKGVVAVAVLLAFVMAAFIGTGAMAQKTKTKSGEVADVMMIKDPLFKKYKKAPVKFTHKLHVEKYKIKCADCHHVYKDGKNVFKDGDKVQKCAECHKSPKKNQGKVLSLYNSFHKNCRECHKKAKKGPTKCNQCHPKKKK